MAGSLNALMMPKEHSTRQSAALLQVLQDARRYNLQVGRACLYVQLSVGRGDSKGLGVCQVYKASTQHQDPLAAARFSVMVGNTAAVKPCITVTRQVLLYCLEAALRYTTNETKRAVQASDAALLFAIHDDPVQVDNRLAGHDLSHASALLPSWKDLLSNSWRPHLCACPFTIMMLMQVS